MSYTKQRLEIKQAAYKLGYPQISFKNALDEVDKAVARDIVFAQRRLNLCIQDIVREHLFNSKFCID